VPLGVRAGGQGGLGGGGGDVTGEGQILRPGGAGSRGVHL
jgi:hypothetical protein